MQLYCPACHAAFTATDRCPTCDGRLVLPNEVRESLSAVATPPPDPIRPTAIGRCAVGVVVVMGLHLGLREWTSALSALTGGSLIADENVAGVVTVALRAIAVLAGGLIAGAGRVQGLATGALTGLVCAGLFLFHDVTAPTVIGLIDLFVLLALTTLAATAGWVGGRVWPSAIELPDALPDPRGSSLARLVEEDKRAKRGRPTKWTQILIGVSAVVAGVAAADHTRVGIKSGSKGLLNVGGPAQAPLVDMEIAALAMIVGGILAGANTGAGLRHGLLTGSFAGLGTVAAAGYGGDSFPLVNEGLHQVLDMALGDALGRQAKLVLFTAVFIGGLVGGWLGGQMFPIIRMRKRLRMLD